MFESFLREEVEIIRKKTDFSWGLAGESEEVIATEKCRKTTPNQRDFQQIQHQKINKQIWKVYLSGKTQCKEWDILRIAGICYTPIYRYEVAGRDKVHHIKILAISI